MPLPYSQVRYEFAMRRLSAPGVTYFGCVAGEATRLHDLESKGFFLPQEGDCGSGEEYKISYKESDFDVPYYDYPAIKSGNRVDPSSVKVYMRNLKYIGMRNVLQGTLNATGQYVAVPLNGQRIKLATVHALNKVVPEGVVASPADDGTLALEFGDGLVNGTVISNQSGEFPIPGTWVIKVESEGKVFLLTDVNHGQGEEHIEVITNESSEELDSENPVTGKLYVYSNAGSVADLTVSSNTLQYSLMGNGDIHLAGRLVIEVTGLTSASTVGSTVKVTTGVPASGEVMCNFARGDSVALSGRSWSYDKGVRNVISLNSTEANLKYEGTDPEMLLAALRETFSDFPDNKDAEDPSEAGYFDVQDVNYEEAVLVAQNQVYSADADPDYRVHTGIALCVLETRARRLLKEDHYQIIEEGGAELLGQLTIDPSTIGISTRVRQFSGAADAYAPAAGVYDSDPEFYPAITPSMPFANYISGDLRIEYEEKVTSQALIHSYGVFRISELSGDTEEALRDRIGQFDPRNMLGFSVGMVRKMTSVDFYVLPYTDSSLFTETLKMYRSIFHVWNVAEGPSPAFVNWITTENLPKQSRFRIGYQYQPIPEKFYRISASAGRSGVLAVNKDNGRRAFTSTTAGVNFLNLSVRPGDTFRIPGSEETFTVEFVSSKALSFTERFSRISDFNLHRMEDDGTGTFEYTFEYDVQAGSARIKAKLLHEPTGATSFVEFYAGEAPEGIEASTGATGNSMSAEPSADYQILSARVSAVPDPETVTGYSIDRTLTPTEQANHLVASQTSNEPSNVLVLSKDIKFRNMDGDEVMLPNYAIPVVIFASKITLLPHMPLTDVYFDTADGELGEVTGLRQFKRDEHLEALGDAGYCIINSLVGGKPFCESDFTAGYKLFRESDRGLLSKWTPVLLYGKDTYGITKRFIGPMNTGTPELLSLVNLTLISLKEKYTVTTYPLLGSLLKSVADTSVTSQGSYTMIVHRISSQDPSRYIDNLIYVE